MSNFEKLFGADVKENVKKYKICENIFFAPIFLQNILKLSQKILA